MLPTKAIQSHVQRTLNPESADAPVSADTPLYAVMLPSGHIEVIPPEDIEDTPRYTMTPEGREEIHQARVNERPGQFVMQGLKRAKIDTAWMDEELPS